MREKKATILQNLLLTTYPFKYYELKSTFMPYIVLNDFFLEVVILIVQSIKKNIPAKCDHRFTIY